MPGAVPEAAGPPLVLAPAVAVLGAAGCVGRAAQRPFHSCNIRGQSTLDKKAIINNNFVCVKNNHGGESRNFSGGDKKKNVGAKP